MPFLISTLDDAKPLIRSISCWSVSRYAPWIVAQPQVEGQVLATVLRKYGERCLDNNKRVQEAAISAMATVYPNLTASLLSVLPRRSSVPVLCSPAQVEEMAGATVTPYLGEILQVLLAAFGKYQAKNLLILFDAVATLAEGTLPAPVRCASRGWDLTSVGSGVCSGGQRAGAAGGGRRADARGAGQVGEPTR